MTGGSERVAVIIEDDPDIRELLETVLGQAGFRTHSSETGNDGVRLVQEVAPLVVTLDISLPDIDGFEVARRIRPVSDAYIVMLTARAEEIDALMGLDSGADDYQTKPFRPRELRARIEAMLRRPRRAGGVAEQADPGSPSVLGSDGLEVDVLSRMTRVDGADIHLTRSEFDILAELTSRPGRVVSKNELVRVLWADAYDTGTPISEADRRSVEVHVANLRRKLGDSSLEPRWIHTVRGLGYRFTPTGG
ncbi:two component transcriptional regulator, winged helix family [Beutenbergia cavernae DSM 12333]|uniref:Two component transcriptional regulator, winged helix family n=1 Tax=Beutenbergia cavernae (strain ATCC BAA-8 / DSM 12333 / CCUG 43141 / JCM 11478 / NBRC 16432 / NCIMB 13614 / HKI 0122) TaxID=471853 RepID=C5BZE3_BEUC1|nr:response regulator transcription factor [Beutenbergia cavernae]ACQ79115.1 two component transcriptional regulator, winged helix family [Beutenbergia cavernae DSM 12333]